MSLVSFAIGPSDKSTSTSLYLFIFDVHLLCVNVYLYAAFIKLSNIRLILLL